MSSFFEYQANVNLNRRFIALDSAGKEITKLDFIKMIANGDFYAVRLLDKDSIPVYKPYPFLFSDDPELKHINRQMAIRLYENVMDENKAVHNFRLPDINGNLVDLEKLRGKVVVLKFWFIACHACVEEFPLVNSIAAKYPRFRFISIATDPKEKLRSFLKDRELKYAVIPDAEPYTNKLGIRAWPTHIVIDRSGTVVKYVNDARDLIETLDKL